MLEDVIIQDGKTQLKGILAIPAGAKGVVIFAHGSGSGRLSPRNQFVARKLQEHGMATLLMDLLSEDEERDRSNVFDIELLADRLLLSKRWLALRKETQSLVVGYFGASTGAGAALVAAAKSPTNVFAVVSRGGRPDLAELYLPQVQAPTLLIVGGDDDIVIQLNNRALERMTCERKLKIVPGATHLFEEHGALEQVASQATVWLQDHIFSAEGGRENRPLLQ